MRKFIARGLKHYNSKRFHKTVTVFAETMNGAVHKVEREQDAAYNWIVVETTRELQQ